MLQLGKAKIGSLGEEEEEAQNYLYHIFLFKVSIWDKMQHGIWIRIEQGVGITFL
jgi:hypothetical protein